MAVERLDNALKNDLISFDQRVLLTDLVDEYEMPYDDVQRSVQKYIEEEEKCASMKFEKHFLVHGLERDSTNEHFTVVPEAKLSEWLKKLKNAESKLYAVEVVGGSKTAAQDPKPMRYCTIGFEDSLKSTTKENKQTPAKEVKKPEVNKSNLEEKKSLPAEKKQPAPKRPAATPEKKSALAKKKVSPEVKKTPTNTKGISNFFAPADKAQPKKEEPPTPKKIQEFFKKKPEEPAPKNVKKSPPAANVSVQLFDEDEDKQSVASSSDEEEKIAALKRQVGSDHDEDGPASSSSKRRRIVDSDDEEEERQTKVEKVDEPAEEAKSEVYMDDDGFVITIKPKNSTAAKAKKPSPPIAAKKSTAPVAPAATSSTKRKVSPKTAPVKSKQGNITSFFKKK